MDISSPTRLSDAAVLDAWEAGTGRPPLDRALAIVSHGFPETDLEALDAWPIGMRDAALLQIHRGTFGEALDALVPCAACGERLELSLPGAALRLEPAGPGEEHELLVGDLTLRFHAVATRHLRAALAEPDRARAAIVERCVTQATRADEPVDPAALPDDVVAALAARMAEVDPQADLRIALDCPECGHAWTAVLDLADFVWRQLDSRARALLGDVARLAARYGWEERAILALSPARRRAYLELAGA